MIKEPKIDEDILMAENNLNLIKYINFILDEKSLKQSEISNLFDMIQARVSMLRNEKENVFKINYLFKLLHILDKKIEFKLVDGQVLILRDKTNMSYEELNELNTKELMKSLSYNFKELKLTEKEIAKILKISQSRISNIIHYDKYHNDFKIDSLLRYLHRLNLTFIFNFNSDNNSISLSSAKGDFFTFAEL